MLEALQVSDTIVYLGAAVVCVPLAKRAGLGAVLGYLIAGAAIGPWGLQLVTDPEATLHFAEFGVVLMLFLIGLEIDLKRLLAMRHAVFGGGGLQMTLGGAALAGALLWLGLPWVVALVIGLAVAMSSTAVAVQLMTEKNLLGAPIGRSAIAVLLFQDLAAIPLIAAVPLLAGERAPGAMGWVAAATAVGAIAAVILAGNYLMRPLIRIIAATKVREIFTAFALLLVVVVAKVMTWAGLSPGLGAFLAGALLASSEYRHALESDIGPFKGLLLGLFFIAVGMSIDFDLVRVQPALLAVLVVGLVGIKGLLLAAIAPRLAVPPRERWLFAALLAQGGEFAFVVLGAARESRFLADEWNALLTAAVAISMAVTPLLVIAAERFAARLAAQRDDDRIDGEDAPVIIAGFGRYGQIIGRLLFAHGTRAIVLDHDPDQIDLVRRFGHRVFYGDATRLALLEAAGAARAKLLVVAIDQVGDNLALVDLARERFPHLRIIARARNVRHWLELNARGVTAERETFESALRSGRQALEALGVPPFEARELAENFRRHNQTVLQSMQPHFHDEAKLVDAAKSGLAELEEQLLRDRAAREKLRGDDW